MTILKNADESKSILRGDLVFHKDSCCSQRK